MPRRTRSYLEDLDLTDDQAGPVTSQEMVNVLSTSYDHLSVRRSARRGRPASLRTRLAVEAWVKNVAYAKDVWVDVVLMDGERQAVGVKRLRLDYLGPAADDGDRFGIEMFL